MRTRWHAGRVPMLLAAPLMLAAALTAAGPAAGASAAGCRAITGVPPLSPGEVENELNAVAAVSACDAWAVGFDRTGDERQTLTEHWNGTSWTVVPSPSPGTGNNVLNSIRAASSTDVWAVGFADTLGGLTQVLIEHWDGTSWSDVPMPSSTTSRLNGVRVVSAGNVWAVGTITDPVSNNSQTLILHRSGNSWARVMSPNPGPAGTDNTLTGVAATSARDVWAVGGSRKDGKNSALILHWNGQRWSPSHLPAAASGSVLSAVGASSPRDAWAVGTKNGQALTLHWNGVKWTRLASPHPGVSSTLAAVAATSAGNAWAVGGIDFTGATTKQTLILHWNGRAWSRVASPNPGDDINALRGIGASSAGNAWAVGSSDTGSQPEAAVAVHCC
jgi:hypothetical protein